MGMEKKAHIRELLTSESGSRQWLEAYGCPWTEADVERLYQEFEDTLRQVVAEHSTPIPGVVETVAKLREQGLRIGSTTGYTDKMMAIVAPIAREKGYEPECWFSPDSTGQKGRPYPYMIFRNMETLGIDDVRKVLKVGDTASDIREGKNAGVWSAGVAVGSSEMGLTLEEYQALSPEEKEEKCRETAEKFKAAGADYVFDTLEDLVEALG